MTAIVPSLLNVFSPLLLLLIPILFKPTVAWLQSRWDPFRNLI